VVGASFWRVVLYWDHERVAVGMARSRAAGERPSAERYDSRRPRLEICRRVARHPRHGVTATPPGYEPTLMSVRFLILVFTSIVDTESPPGKPVRLQSPWVTKAVLPSG
jgi:hypothetical protein